jgi:hypothetical protein
MAIANYTDLQAQVADFMARSDISGNVADFITLAEARLNRQIEPIATSTVLTGTVNSNILDISSLSMIEPISLYVDGAVHEFNVLPRPQGSFPYYDIPATPSEWCIDQDRILFDRPLDLPYTFRFTYQGKFALSDLAPTNSFLTNFPDVYLAASLFQACLYVKDDAGMAQWKAISDEGISEARSTIAQSKRGTLTVDPMLTRAGRYSFNLDSSI